ncbi:MAG: HD domain-containing protein [Candidatus Omnitrophica bacterium]|nr:HD domain-containing protein [Candidatus Omnitrophota bacterium]
METIRDFLMKMSAALAAVRMYPVTHPQFLKVMTVAYERLQEILKDREQLIIGIIDNEIIFEKEVLFELNVMLEQFIKYATEKGVEKIYIQKSVSEDEFSNFISLLVEKLDDRNSMKAALIEKNVQHIQIGALTTPAEERKNAITGCLVVYEDCLKDLPQYFAKLLDVSSETGHAYGELRSVIAKLRENFLGQYFEFLHLDELKHYNRIYFHSINVALLAMSFSVTLGFEEKHLIDVGIAGLLHDIGRIYLDIASNDKSFSEKKDAFSRMENHCYLGSKLLLKHCHQLGVLPVIVAFEHHIRTQRKEDKKMAIRSISHISSQIVAVCDFYDTITQRRNERYDYPPDLIYRVMMEKSGELFHPQLLARFFKFLGVWPNGAIVMLSSDEVAIVRGQNTDIFAPTVEIMGLQENRSMLNLSDTKDGRKIVKSLNPFVDGQPYLMHI